MIRKMLRSRVAVTLALSMALILAFSTLPLAGTAAAPERQVFLVGFTSRPGPAQMDMLHRMGRVVHVFDFIPVVAIELPAAVPEHARAQLQGVHGVRFVEENGEVWALETVPWGVSRIKAPDAWTGSRGTGVKVAILDTGIDYTHEDLAVRGGANFIDNKDYKDYHGHGTHVAGTVAALRNGLGVVGVAYEAHLYAVKVLGDDGSGSWLSVAQGIEWSVQNGMKVINMSLGGSQGSSTLEQACQAAWNAGLVPVAAAGNSGTPAGRGNNVGYPARYETVIAVAASDANDRRASWSSTGPAVELIAPGVSILSTVPGNKYAQYSGTSMASPHVAGVAALVWAANSGLTNTQVRQILRDTAENLGLPAEQQGYGLVRADLAVAKALGGVQPPPPPEEPEPGGDLAVAVATDKPEYKSKETVSITVTVTVDGAPVEGAAVNVKVTTPSGKVYGGSGNTDARGVAVLTYKHKVPDGTGTFLVDAAAGKAGYTGGSGSATFVVR